MKTTAYSTKKNKKGNDVQPEEISRVVRAKLGKILVEMSADCRDIIGAIVSSSDGMAWAEHLPTDMQQHRFAAMSSALLALSDNVIQEALNSTIKDVLLQSDDGNIFIIHAGNDLLLTVFSSATTNIGMPLAHARKVAEDIAELNLQPQNSTSW